MALPRAFRPTAVMSVPGPVAAAWATLDRRGAMELVVPGTVIGLLGGLIAGGMAAAGGLSPGLALFSALALGLPLAGVGAAYEILLAKGRLPLGPLAPAALVWLVGFPVCRVVHAVLVNMYAGSDVTVPHGWLDFVVYSMLLSVGFAVGFWWLHENFAPRWWMHLEHRNPVARYFMSVLVRGVQEREEQRKPRERRRRRRAKHPAARAGGRSR
jgi:hypothetical protein